MSPRWWARSEASCSRTSSTAPPPSEVRPRHVRWDSPKRTGHRGLETSGPAEGCNHQSGPVWRIRCVDTPGQEHSGVQGEAPHGLTVNMCLRTMWSSMAVIVKPWTDRISVDRTEDGSLPTSTIPGNSEELNTATSKLDKLLRSANKLIFIHGTGELVTQGPPAPPTPNLEIAMSTEVDTYLCAVLEAETVDGAAALWRPGPSKPGQHKRLQQQPKHSKGNRGYSRGCGGFKGRGSGGWRGRGGYRRPAPTVVYTGVHYHHYWDDSVRQLILNFQ